MVGTEVPPVVGTEVEARGLKPDAGAGADGAAIPTSRMNRIDHGMVYDKEGIAPDVRISADETDVIGFVQRYWTKR